MEYPQDQVEMYRKLLGDYADSAMQMFETMDDTRATEVLIQGILTDDQGEKLATFREMEERIIAQVESSAEEWWRAHGEERGSVPDTGSGSELQLEEFTEAGKSVEYVHQLYYDAAKAQVRLKDLASQIETDESTKDWMKGSMPSVKGIARATQKARMGEEPLGDEPYAAGLRDLSRGTIEVNRLDQIIPGVEAFLKKCKDAVEGAAVTRFKNKFKDLKTSDSGYADIQIHLRLDGGHICEMQFQCKSLLDFKSLGGKHRKPEDGNKLASWDTLLGDKSGMLTETQTLVTGLKTRTDPILEMPNDAQESVAAFADCADGSWPLNAHIIYNITRWIDENKDTIDAGADKAAVGYIHNTNDKLNVLSKAGADAAQDVLAEELGGAEAYESTLEELAAFTIPIAPIT
jgi:hypothetical protein